MNNTKVFGIKKMDFFKFISKINELYHNHKFFITQKFKDQNRFYAVIYFNLGDRI
jgi:hypothetical protein